MQSNKSVQNVSPAKTSLAIKNVNTLPVIRIQPSRGLSLFFKFGELWKYHELLYFLIWRDVKVRYKQTILGIAWAVIQPFLTMVVFSIFFGHLGNIPSDDIPYPIFSFAALVPWTFFANGLNQTSNSLVGNANLIKKVYFPRLIIPIATVLSGVVDFVLAFVVLIGMMFYFNIIPTIQIVWIPLFLLLALFASLGVSLLFSAMNVQFRDVRYVIPFLTQFWLFSTPIAYPSSLLTGTWRTLYAINPMVGVVDGFRWALLGTRTCPGTMIIVSALVAFLLMLIGTLYFLRMEKTFSDII